MIIQFRVFGMNIFKVFTKKSFYKVVVSNDSDELKILYLEPWGEDYIMKPREEFEIIEEDTQDVYFHVQINNDCINVFVEGSGNSYPKIYSNGEWIQCGYNRKLLGDK